MPADNPTLQERARAPIDEIGQHIKLDIDHAHHRRPISLELGSYTDAGWLARGLAFLSPNEARAVARALHDRADEAEMVGDV